jgi:hypothetical protein
MAADRRSMAAECRDGKALSLVSVPGSLVYKPIESPAESNPIKFVCDQAADLRRKRS